MYFLSKLVAAMQAFCDINFRIKVFFGQKSCSPSNLLALQSTSITLYELHLRVILFMFFTLSLLSNMLIINRMIYYLYE